MYYSFQNLPPKELLPGPKSNKAPPTEKPPPPPPQESEESIKNQRNLSRLSQDDIIDKQEQEIIASLELEEREHKKYMDTVNAMRNLSPSTNFSIAHCIFGHIGQFPLFYIWDDHSTFLTTFIEKLKPRITKA